MLVVGREGLARGGKGAGSTCSPDFLRSRPRHGNYFDHLSI